MAEPVNRAVLNTLWVDVDGEKMMVMTATVYPGGRFAGYVELKAPLGRDESQSWQVTPPGIASFRRLYVHPEWRRHGLATQMVTAIEELCARKRCHYVGCLVEETNAAGRALYEALGYENDPDHNITWHNKPTDLGMIKFIVPTHGIGRPVDGE